MSYLQSHEQAIRNREQALLQEIKVPSNEDDPKSWSILKDEALSLARCWKEYLSLPRTADEAPRNQVAVKHGAALLRLYGRKVNCLKELLRNTEELRVLEPALAYGFEVPTEKPSTPPEIKPCSIADFPLSESQPEGLFIFHSKSGYFPIVTKFTSSNMRVLSLDRINSCTTCPARGRCSLTDKCISYRKPEYDSARQVLIRDATTKLLDSSKSPSVEDYKLFAGYKFKKRTSD